MKHSLEQIDLKCGAKLLLINVPNSSSVCFSTTLRGGFWYLPKEEYELPHLLEHVASSRGNKTYPKGLDFVYQVEKNGAYKNAFTSSENLGFIFGCGKSELESITKLALAQIKEPLFREEDIARDKKVIEKELSTNLEEDGSRCRYRNTQIINPSLPDYTYRIKCLDKITRKDILNYYNKYFACRNLYFVVTGDIDKKARGLLVKEMESSLSDYQKGTAIKIKKIIVGKYQREISVLDSKMASQSHFYANFVNLSYKDSDEEVMSVINTIYNRGTSARIFQKTRENGLAYWVDSKYNNNPNSYTNFAIRSQTTPEKMLELFVVCMRELSDICAGNYSEAEFTRAKGYIVGLNARTFETPSEFANWYEYDFSMGLKLKSPQEYTNNIKRVTREDIARVCKKYFTKDSWCLTLVGQNIDEDQYRKVLDKYFK